MTNHTEALSALTTDNLVSLYNSTFGKKVKKGSYTRKRMFTELLAHMEALDAEKAAADPDACPFCHGDPSNQTPAGPEGTFLGDSCNFCHECGKTYNRHTGDEVEDLPEPKKGKGRRILNPQPVIDKKTDLCAEQGIDVLYVRCDRLWAFADTKRKGKIFLTMTSRDFTQYKPEELASYAFQMMTLARKSKK